VLESIDLNADIRKSEYKTQMSAMEIQLSALQRRAIERGVPVIVVFEGWDAAGKGDLINRLILSLDPRHFSVHAIREPSDDERRLPFLRRFWTRTPATGRMAVFDRSWYMRVLEERVERTVSKKRWKRAYDRINSFERMLVDDGALIIKLFLHISAKEQRQRFRALEKNPSTAWRVTKEDWKRHGKRDEYVAAAEDMFACTDTDIAPWTIVPAENRRAARLTLFRSVIDRLEQRLDEPERPPASRAQRPDAGDSPLDGVDLSLDLSREMYNELLDERQARIRNLQFDAYRSRLPVIVAYEGWDAAGKGGNIRRLTQRMDPRGYDVIPIGPPNDIERRHHYLWRFWKELPRPGHIAIFDRTWYGRVLVERVEELCAEGEWTRAYDEINGMEAQIIDSGAVLVKFWLHLDKDEQLRRFRARERTPHKRWKITDEDWRNREKWDLYYAAVSDMLRLTSTDRAPWTIVEANDKLHARVKALDTVITAIESAL
jgi:polyphosphate kinase 2 (PPK2 family)